MEIISLVKGNSFQFNMLNGTKLDFSFYFFILTYISKFCNRTQSEFHNGLQ
jgi:hypothetical protein